MARTLAYALLVKKGVDLSVAQGQTRRIGSGRQGGTALR